MCEKDYAAKRGLFWLLQKKHHTYIIFGVESQELTLVNTWNLYREIVLNSREYFEILSNSVEFI